VTGQEALTGSALPRSPPPPHHRGHCHESMGHRSVTVCRPLAPAPRSVSPRPRREDPAARPACRPSRGVPGMSAATNGKGHRSRVSTLMIDCLADRFDESIAFWSRALGFKKPRRPAADQRYLTLGRIEGPLFVRLQKVEDNPGYHLDIESDDINAEADRLEAAGARRKYRIK